MRLLFSYFAGGGGGLSNILRLLSEIAARRPDYEICIVTSRPEDFVSLASHSNVRLVSLDVLFRGELRRLWFGLYGLERLAITLGADVIWSMNLGAYRRPRIPQVLSINNAYQVYPWPVVRLHPSGVLSATVLRFFSRRSLKASSLVLAQTEYMARLVEKCVGSVGSVRVLSKAVDRPSGGRGACFDSAASDGSLEPRPYVFAYVATFFPHKNHSVLFDAMERLAEKRAKIELVCTVALTDLPPAVQRRAKVLVEAGLLHLVGWVHGEQLRDLYARADACVVPSILESLSSAHLEAMSWGKPILTSDLPFARDLCEDAAIYVAPHNGEMWAEEMLSLASNSQLHERYSELARSRLNAFPGSWSEVAAKAEAHLEALVAFAR